MKIVTNIILLNYEGEDPTNYSTFLQATTIHILVNSISNQQHTTEDCHHLCHRCITLAATKKLQVTVQHKWLTDAKKLYKRQKKTLPWTIMGCKKWTHAFITAISWVTLHCNSIKSEVDYVFWNTFHLNDQQKSHTAVQYHNNTSNNVNTNSKILKKH